MTAAEMAGRRRLGSSRTSVPARNAAQRSSLISVSFASVLNLHWPRGSPAAQVRDVNILLTVSEVRRLFHLHASATRPGARHESWPDWRRRHQARARRCHYQRRRTISNRLLL